MDQQGTFQMSMMFRIFGSVDAPPSADELLETLGEKDFDLTLENEEEDEDEEESWAELMVYESSMDGAIRLFRYTEGEQLSDDLSSLMDGLADREDAEQAGQILGLLENSTVGYGIDLPDELEGDDNAILLCSLLAQMLAQKCDGIYCVDDEYYFTETGDLMLATVEEDEEEE